MKKILFLSISGLLAALVVTFGLVYTTSAHKGDVGHPQKTPEAGMVKYQSLDNAMSPTIKDGDWLLAKADAGEAKRGDLIILHFPSDPSKLYCRRVLAVGGDRVVMRYYSNVKQATVFTPEHPEGVVFPADITPTGNAYGEYRATVEPGKLYVVGDNTVPGASYDSDEWGLLPAADIAGIVIQRLEPNPRGF